MPVYSVDKLISEARRIAAEYRRATGKPLGISAEIAQHDACHYLHLEPVEAETGYDAIGVEEPRKGRRIQIKGRAIFDESKGGQRLGQLRLEQDWDSVALVLMDPEFETTEIYEASRQAILDALEDATQSRRSNRGAMSVARFKHIAQLVWTREEGLITNIIWSNQSV